MKMTQQQTVAGYHQFNAHQLVQQSSTLSSLTEGWVESQESPASGDFVLLFAIWINRFLRCFLPPLDVKEDLCGQDSLQATNSMNGNHSIDSNH